MQVKWYKCATKMLDEALEYAVDMFGERIARNFYNKVKRYDTLLADNPHIGGIEPLLSHRKREYRSLVVHDCFKLIYYINKNTICVIASWNCIDFKFYHNRGWLDVDPDSLFASVIFGDFRKKSPLGF